MTGNPENPVIGWDPPAEAAASSSRGHDKPLSGASPMPKRPKKVPEGGTVPFGEYPDVDLPESSASSVYPVSSSVIRLKQAELEHEIANQKAIMNEMRVRQQVVLAQQEQLALQRNLDASAIRMCAMKVELMQAEVRSYIGSRASNASSAEPAPMPGTDAEGGGDLERDLNALMECRLPEGVPLPLQDVPVVFGAFNV